jgi:hypothetical protein
MLCVKKNCVRGNVQKRLVLVLMLIHIISTLFLCLANHVLNVCRVTPFLVTFRHSAHPDSYKGHISSYRHNIYIFMLWLFAPLEPYCVHI